jgi:hypothetical protein
MGVDAIMRIPHGQVCKCAVKYGKLLIHHFIDLFMGRQGFEGPVKHKIGHDQEDNE